MYYLYAHPPATLDSSRSSSSASWCNASVDSWGAPGKHSRMMLMLSKLPWGGKRWVMNGWPYKCQHVRHDHVPAELFAEKDHVHLKVHAAALRRRSGAVLNGVWKKLWHFKVIQAEAPLCNSVTVWRDGHNGQAQQEVRERVHMWPVLIRMCSLIKLISCIIAPMICQPEPHLLRSNGRSWEIHRGRRCSPHARWYDVIKQNSNNLLDKLIKSLHKMSYCAVKTSY